jgi:hypothetical protein
MKASRAGILLAAAAVVLGLASSHAEAAKKEAPVAHAKVKEMPLAEAKTVIVPFRHTPFPYRGMIPEKDVPFMDVVDGHRRGHTSPRAGVYWEDETYSDRNVLIAFPKDFTLAKPALIVVFFHGNGATLERDVLDRQRIAEQVADSGLNAVLVAPQFAHDALDSSAGSFWTPGVFRQFLDEASGKLADAYGERKAREAFARMPVVLVAYSGGYNPAAYALHLGGADRRIAGIVLFDAVYAEEEKFAGFLKRHRKAFFFSTWSKSAAAGNANIRRFLDADHIAYSTSTPKSLKPGSITFFAADPETVHDDFMTSAWVPDPLAWVLARIPGYPR